MTAADSLAPPLADCELCQQDGGEVLYRDALLRVVRVDDPHYPGFCRVILNRHAREMSDLDPAEQARMMAVVLAVESAVRAVCQPDKVNLASLGNVVPHVHWHVIPRWENDRHFPNPIWGEVKRPDACPPQIDPAALHAAILARLPHD